MNVRRPGAFQPYPHLRPRQLTPEPSPAVVTLPSPSPPPAATTITTATATATSSSSSSAASSSSAVSGVSSSTSSSTLSPITSTTVILLTSSTPSTTSQSTSSEPSTTSLLPTSTASDSASRISRLISTRSDGGVITITTIVDPDTSSTSSTTNNDNNSGENVGFLQNKAAMGATFTVAGLAAAVFAFLLITTCIRRRRAMKFDRDVAAAAAVAAAESHAIQPFDDDDDDVFTGAPRAQGGGYGYAPGKLPEHDPYTYAATGIVGGAPTGFAATQPMRQQQTGGPLAYPTAQQYPVQLYDQPYNGGVFGRQVGQQEAYNMQDLSIPAEMPRRPGSAGTGHDTLPGIAGVGAQSNNSGAGAGAGDSRNTAFSALVGAAGLAGSAGAAAAAAFRSRHEDPYGGYAATPVGESRYPQPRWSQQFSQPTPPEQLQSGWYQQQGQQPVQRASSPPTSTSTHSPAPAYSPGGLTAQGYPNEKSTYSNARSATSAQTSSNEGPSTSGHTGVSTNVPGTPPDEDDVGSVLEDHEGPRVLKVTNE